MAATIEDLMGELKNLIDNKQYQEANQFCVSNKEQLKEWKGGDGNTILHFAIQENYLFVATVFCEEDAINAKNEAGDTPLHTAARINSVDGVHFLTQKGANLNEQNKQGETPLHIMAAKTIKSFNDVAPITNIVTLLLDKGADVNVKDQQIDGTALHTAVLCRNELVAGLLLGKGKNIDLDATMWSGDTALHIAVDNNHQDMARLLLDRIRAANVNKKKLKGAGDTPLHIAVEKNNEPMARLLLERGGDLKAKNHEGDTPLHTVAAAKIDEPAPALVGLLIEKGADVNAINSLNKTPLHVALLFGKEWMASLLLQEKNVDVNATTFFGETPLHLAVRYSNNTSIVVSLLEKGADVRAQTEDKETALQIAQRLGKKDIMNVLQNASTATPQEATQPSSSNLPSKAEQGVTRRRLGSNVYSTFGGGKQTSNDTGPSNGNKPEPGKSGRTG